MIRLHVPDPLAVGGRIELAPDQARYLLSVMRQEAGAPLLLFNGLDGEWRGRLEPAGKRGAVVALEARTRDQASGPDLDLLIALVKRNRLESIVEKAVELGVRRVRLVITRRTQADHTNVARLQAIATEAAEQTGRLDVPEVLAPEKLDRVLDGWGAGRRLLFCDEAGAAPPALAALAEEGPWAVLIGPEGGFAPEEREALRALPFVTPASLGPRILRADTAAFSAMTLWQARLGDWR